MFKRIPLLPTKFNLDVWICDDLQQLAESFHVKYGASVDYYKDELRPYATQILDSTVDSESKGEEIIVMTLIALDYAIVAHEITHVLFKLSEHLGIETSSKSQEWCAYFVGYVFDEILKIEVKEEIL